MGIAGFYRSSDHRASAEDQDACQDVDRHVEVFSWGGLTSRRQNPGGSGWPLLPFLFGQTLAGWIVPAQNPHVGVAVSGCTA